MWVGDARSTPTSRIRRHQSVPDRQTVQLQGVEASNRSRILLRSRSTTATRSPCPVLWVGRISRPPSDPVYVELCIHHKAGGVYAQFDGGPDRATVRGPRGPGTGPPRRAVARMEWQVRLHVVERWERYFGVLDPTKGWIGRKSGGLSSQRAVTATLIRVSLIAITIVPGIQELKNARLSR